MSYTFAIGDLHGRSDLLEKALSAIYAYDMAGGTVVFTGDYVDRGPDSRGVLDILKRGPKDDKWRFVCLRGNHEDMQIQWSKHQIGAGLYMANGGRETLLSYSADVNDPNGYATISHDHLEWIEQLPYYYEDEFRVYVHAFCEPYVPLEEQSVDKMTWRVYPGHAEGGYWGSNRAETPKHVVHGHEPLPNGPERHAYRTNIDTCAWYTGRLAVEVFHDLTPGRSVDSFDVVEALAL